MNELSCSVREAIRVSGLGRTKLYELMDNGTLASVKIGTRRLINWASLRKLLTPASTPTPAPNSGEQRRTSTNDEGIKVRQQSRIGEMRRTIANKH